MGGISCLIVGGTGTLGRALALNLLERDLVGTLGIFSRDELKQSEMAREFGSHAHQMRYHIGDVRDFGRLAECVAGYDAVIHAAALKQIPACEDNVYEAIKTNSIGTQNVLSAALANHVKSLVFVSTDKAVAPINLYGASKMVAEKMVLSAACLSSSTRINVVRYGNVAGSRGSVIPLFSSLAKNRQSRFPVTDSRMTRFWTDIPVALKAIEMALTKDLNGCVIIPKCPSFKIVDLVRAFDLEAEIELTGIRPGEKLEETLIAPLQMPFLAETEDYYFQSGIVSPCLGEPISIETCYASSSNSAWLSVASIRQKLIEGGWLESI